MRLRVSWLYYYSGTGKTTLLNLLSQRNTSQLLVAGEVRVNGAQVRDLNAIDALSGYVQQKDIFIGTLTVAEHLWFQAMLRLDRHMSKDERNQMVDEVIYEVSLGKPIEQLLPGLPKATFTLPNRPTRLPVGLFFDIWQSNTCVAVTVDYAMERFLNLHYASKSFNWVYVCTRTTSLSNQGQRRSMHIGRQRRASNVFFGLLSLLRTFRKID